MSRLFATFLCVTISLATSLAANASIINNAVRDGLNTINDTDADRYTPITPGGNPGGAFMVGDIFDTVLVFNNITNASFLNEDLDTATGGGANYQLAALGQFVISAVQASVTGPVGTIDVMFTGSIDVYESTNALNLVNFSTDTFTEAQGKVSGSLIGDAGFPAVTSLLSLSVDFFQFLAQPPALPLPGFPGIVGDGGLSVTANPGNIGIVAGATSISYLDFATGLPTSSSHDVTVRNQIFTNQGVNSAEFPFLTDTTVQFTSAAIPEPMSAIVWALIAACGLVGANNFGRSRRAAE